MKCNNTLCKRHLSNGECVKLAGEECMYDKAKKIIKALLNYIFTPEGFEKLDKGIVEQAEQFIGEENGQSN